MIEILFLEKKNLILYQKVFKVEQAFFYKIWIMKIWSKAKEIQFWFHNNN